MQSSFRLANLYLAVKRVSSVIIVLCKIFKISKGWHFQSRLFLMEDVQGESNLHEVFAAGKKMVLLIVKWYVSNGYGIQH